MKNISDNLKKLKSQLPANVKLVAVSKTQSVEAIKTAYDTGQKIFGENKVQELFAKYEKLKHLDIEWHLIGHLQTNKVKYIAPFVDTIQSVDSFKLLKEIDKEAKKHNRIIKCLLQFYIAQEETKFGLSYEEAINILESEDVNNLQNICICGVMGIASFTEDIEKIKSEFTVLKNCFVNLKENYFKTKSEFIEISMGMSNDWRIAIQQNSTIIRIGSSIFGERN